MQQPRIIFLCVFLSLAISSVSGHICLVNPAQRGGYNITSPGQRVCFQPQGPCGNKPPENPKITWDGDSGVSVLFQQNLNHYNPGWPGFMDLAWAEGANPADGDFIVAARVNDWWSHSQASQTNFTVHMNVPNIDCSHCVLRVRYVPNKPEEPVFHNCADFAIRKQPRPNSLFNKGILGFFQPSGRQFDARNKIARIFLQGKVADLTEQFVLRSPNLRHPRTDPDEFVLGNGLAAPSSDSKSLFVIADSVKNVQQQDQPLKQLVQVDTHTGSISSLIPLTGLPEDAQVTGLVNAGDSMILVALKQVKSGYQFSVHHLSPQGIVSNAIATIASNPPYVNFMWVSYNSKTSEVYVYVGDEDAPFTLRATLYTVSLSSGKVSSVIPDFSQFTLTGIHADPKSGKLYGLSPGLFKAKEHSWTLVTIDPSSGSVKPVGPIGGASPSGSQALYYGGNVYGHPITSDGKFVHIFHRKDGTVVLGSVDLQSGKLSYSTDIDLGVNRAHELVSVVRLE